RSLCHCVSLTLFLEKMVHGHVPPRHCWLCVGHVPAAEDRRMLEIIGLTPLSCYFASPLCLSRKARTAWLNAAGCSMLLRWPAVGIMTSSAPGIFACMAR